MLTVEQRTCTHRECHETICCKRLQGAVRDPTEVNARDMHTQGDMLILVLQSAAFIA